MSDNKEEVKSLSFEQYQNVTTQISNFVRFIARKSLSHPIPFTLGQGSSAKMARFDSVEIKCNNDKAIIVFENGGNFSSRSNSRKSSHIIQWPLISVNS